MLNIVLLTLGILTIFIGDFSYLIDTIKGKVKPNRVTWLLWGIMPIIIYVAQISKGVGSISLLTLATGIIPFFVFFATYFNKKAEWKLTKFDLACGACSVIGLVLWYFSKNGNVAILFSIIANIFVGIPTYRKAFSHPETESYLVYFLNTIGIGMGILTIEVWDFANIAFSIYVFLACLLLTVLVRFKIGKKIKI